MEPGKTENFPVPVPNVYRLIFNETSMYYACAIQLFMLDYKTIFSFQWQMKNYNADPFVLVKKSISNVYNNFGWL